MLSCRVEFRFKEEDLSIKECQWMYIRKLCQYGKKEGNMEVDMKEGNQDGIMISRFLLLQEGDHFAEKVNIWDADWEEDAVEVVEEE